MADSLHDSLTDTHKPRESPPSYQEETISRPTRLNLQNVEALEKGLTEGGTQGGELSLQQGNWLERAQPVQDIRSPDASHNHRIANGMDIDIDRGPTSRSGGEELLVGASSVPNNAAALVQHHQRKEEETLKELEEERRREGQDSNPDLSNEGSLAQDATKRPSGLQDSTMGDGQSLASTKQSISGAAMPHEGGPSITHLEAVDALEQAEQGLEAGGGYSDDGYQTDSSATSQSLATSAREFIYEHGRRYHSYKADVNPYLFPNDDREQDREDLKHAMFLKLFNKTLHFAPVPTVGANVIDLGTGTGIWCVDFADLYPSATVLGIDLSPIQTVWVPPNLKFMVDDAEAEWLHPANSFDLVHTRHTIQAFRNWPRIFERAFTHLKPGAWMECQELDHVPQCSDGTMATDDPMLTYWLNVAAGLKTFGVDFRLAPSLASMMRAAGFINVTERIFYTPIGPWPKNRALKEVGLYWRAVLMEGVEAIAMAPFIRGLGWRKEEVEVFIAGVRKAYEKTSKDVHAWMPSYVVYGQKP